MPDEQAQQTAAPAPPQPGREIPDPLFAFVEQAVRENATDIHIDLWAEEATVRFRVDGAIHVKERLTRGQAERVLNQIKVVSELDIEAVHAPVEGHFRGRFDGQVRNLRATLVPTAPRHQAAHLRLLSAPEDFLDIDQLGMSDRDLAQVEGAMRTPHGLVLAAGPTGSGKTTTLYALAAVGDRENRVVASIEDPVEFDLDYVRQLEVDEEQGLTMLAGLKSLLRMDPDILLVGEVRDRESATIAAQAAMAGRLVLATVHARDAAAAVEAMHYLTVPNYVLGGAMRLVIGQNLVRLACRDCRRTREPGPHEKTVFKRAGITAPDEVVEPVGCNECNGYGFRGRTGVFETVPIDDELGHWIARGQPQHAIRRRFLEVGAASLAADALEKVAAGLTPMREVLPFCVRIMEVPEEALRQLSPRARAAASSL